MAIPPVAELVQPALTHLRRGPLAPKELADRLARELSLSAEDLALMNGPGTVTIWRNRVAWVLVWLGKQGLARKDADGRYAAPSGAPLPAAPGDSAPLDPEGQMAAAHAVMMEQLEAAVLERVQALTPTSFERLVVALLAGLLRRPKAEIQAAHLGRTADGGVDGVVSDDLLGLNPIYIQAKRYAAANKVGPEAVQAFFGAFRRKGATRGVFVTASDFTPAGRQAAAELSKQGMVRLIEGRELVRLMIGQGIGVRLRTSYPVYDLDAASLVVEE